MSPSVADIISKRSNLSSSYQVVHETWLTRKPKPESLVVTAATTLVFLVANFAYLNNWSRASEWMPASYDAVFNHGEIWRLWTTLAAHADMGHFLSNSFLFFILGYFLYGYFGLRVFPFGVTLCGGVVNLIVLPTYPPNTYLIGVSGVIYLMGGTWLTLFFLLSRQKELHQRILRTVGVALVLFMPTEAFDPSVSYRTHFVGFVIGVIFGVQHFLRNRPIFKTAERVETVVDEDP